MKLIYVLLASLTAACVSLARSEGDPRLPCMAVQNERDVESLRLHLGKRVCVEGKLEVGTHGVFFPIERTDGIINLFANRVNIQIGWRDAYERGWRDGEQRKITGTLVCEPWKEEPCVRLALTDLG